MHTLRKRTTILCENGKSVEIKIPLVSALMRPALRPLKSLKTSSTVLGIGCGIPSIPSLFHKNLETKENTLIIKRFCGAIKRRLTELGFCSGARVSSS